MTNHYVGQIAEYGSAEYKNNQSVVTLLNTGVYVNPHGIVHETRLYHYSAGYKPAGSCATWVNESYLVRIYFSDGSSNGHFYSVDKKDEAFTYFEHLKTVRYCHKCGNVLPKHYEDCTEKE